MSSPPRDSAPSRRLGRPPRGWARKNLNIDQRKLDVARKTLGAKTETETVDAALDAIAFRKELSEGVQRLRAAGGLKPGVIGDRSGPTVARPVNFRQRAYRIPKRLARGHGWGPGCQRRRAQRGTTLPFFGKVMAEKVLLCQKWQSMA
jgi:hypothetical protein